MHARAYPSSVPAADLGSAAGLFLAQRAGLRHAADLWLIVGSVTFCAFMLIWPGFILFGLGSWWILNTISHNFIHQPFFKSRRANQLFAIYLSILTLVPHCWWRDKHLAHHADRPWRPRLCREAAIQATVIVLTVTALTARWPSVAVYAVMPGFLLAMLLCFLHGYFEHATGTTSHYGPLYNRLFFNDGFHVEHHKHPGLHWTSLPRSRETSANTSNWPAILRWFDWFTLNGLETFATRSALIRRWLLAAHERALRKIALQPNPAHVAIIGGGLFPRTALVIHRIWPAARVTIIDSNRAHLDACRPWLRGDETLLCARVTPDALPSADIVLIPLAFDQDKRALYRNSNETCVIIHDWLWNNPKPQKPSPTRSAVVSILLLKRLNLVQS